MPLHEAFALRCLSVDPEMLSPSEFSAAYYRLAQRYHPDLNPKTRELMANINAARTAILQSYRSPR
jgi:DnaJ-class molecular chaperone